MAKVTLNVEVQSGQLDALEKRVNALDNKKIKLEVDTGSLDQAARSAENFSKAEQNVVNNTQNVTNTTNESNAAYVAISNTLNRITREGDTYNTQIVNIRNSQRQLNEENRRGGALYDILGRSVGSFLARMTAYRAVYGVINTITSSFKDAIQTLKDVDDELVTVRKVTGFDAYQMADVENQAYAVASKYGSTASDYVAGVAEFARAGYKDLSGDLAELSTKAQIVGDTTAETANQFLLSVDAAYKYGGSVQELSRVLDGANELDNKYATSIGKIAEGMGIVAPVAAQMHVGVDELAASIGTITAVTQRSGTETARALRALFLNIVGDTKTEIDEGVTWTTGEIEGLREIIRLYAKDAYDAAQASGSIIDPMKAMEGLSQSLKDGVLSEQQLMQMVSDIGGKLRSSQLLALINNWDMYESMLNDYRNAAGSADKEIENAMDSWTRKSNVLKNTWTEFVKTGLDSNQFKGWLDFLTGIVERLDSLPGVLTRILMIVAGLNIERLASGIGNIGERLSGLWASIRGGVGNINALGTALGIVSVAWGVVSYAVESYKISHEKARQATVEAIQATKDDIANLDDLRAKYEEIVTSTESEAIKNQQLTEYKKLLVEQYGFEKEAVEKINLERQTGLDLLDKEAEASLRRTLTENAATFDKAKDIYQGTTRVGTAEGYNMAQLPVAELERAGAVFEDSYSDLNQISIAGKNLRDVYENLGNVMEVLEKKQLSRQGLNYTEELLLDNLRVQYSELGKQMEDYGAVYEDGIKLQAQYALMTEGVSTKTIESKDAFDGLKRTLHEVYGSDKELWAAMEEMVNQMFPDYASGIRSVGDAADEAGEALNNETADLFANQRALEDNASAADIAAAAQRDAEAAVRMVIPALFDEEGQLTATGRTALAASDALADMVNAQLKLQYEAANANLINLRAQLAGVAADALKAAAAMALAYDAANAARSMGYAVGNLGYDRSSAAGGVGTAYSLLRQIEAAEAEVNGIYVQMSSVGRYTSGGGSSNPSYSPRSSGGSSSGSGRSSGSSSSAAKEVDPNEARRQAAADRVSLLKSELALLKERGASDKKQIAKMKEIQEALHDEANLLREIGGSQEDINGLSREWYSYRNQINDMLSKQAEAAESLSSNLRDAVEAQKALNNAENERTAHIYNKATGQWEWAANPSNVLSAQEALYNAIQKLPGQEQIPYIRALNTSLAGNNIPGQMDYVYPSVQTWTGSIGIPAGERVKYVGDTFNFGGVSLSEAMAKTTTVYELAQMAKNLVVYNRGA